MALSLTRKPASLSPERAELARLIEARADAERRVNANEKAKEAAQAASRAASRDVDAAEAALKDAQSRATQHLVANLRGETDAAVVYPAQARAALAEAQERHSIAYAACETIRDQDFGYSPDFYRPMIAAAAAAVIRAEGADVIAAAAAAVTRHQRELASAAKAFAYLVETGVLAKESTGYATFPADPQHRAARDRLHSPPSSWGGLEVADTSLPFRAAMAALIADADAPLPEFGQ